MPDPAWPSLPPEANYLRLVGPGAAGTATTMANAVAWEVLAASHEAAFSLSTLNAAVTAVDFEGIGGVSSAATVGGLNTSLQLLAGWVQEKTPIAASAVAAYETAVSSMIPAEVCIANRTQQAADVAMNPAVLGALTPAIIALDTEYFGEHWPHNAASGVAYGAALAALSAALAIPPPISPPGASATAPATAAAAVAQSTGRAAAGAALQEFGQLTESVGGAAAMPEAVGQAGQMLMQPIRAVLGSMQPGIGMFQTPIDAAQTLAGLAPSMMRPGSEGGGAAVSPVMLPGAGGGVGGLSSPGITSYSRPTSSFIPEGAGRPLTATSGLLGAAASRGAATAGMGTGAIPMSPIGTGTVARGRGADAHDDGLRARVVVEPQPPSCRPN